MTISNPIVKTLATILVLIEMRLGLSLCVHHVASMVYVRPNCGCPKTSATSLSVSFSIRVVDQ